MRKSTTHALSSSSWEEIEGEEGSSSLGISQESSEEERKQKVSVSSFYFVFIV